MRRKRRENERANEREREKGNERGERKGNEIDITSLFSQGAICFRVLHKQSQDHQQRRQSMQRWRRIDE